MFQAPHVENNKLYKQLLVPSNLRKHVMQLAHDGVLAGHQGVRKTTTKVFLDFFLARCTR